MILVVPIVILCYLPTCESCHQMPHQKEIHDEFPSCDRCHIETHAVEHIVFNR